jgi:hypothetical protein
VFNDLKRLLGQSHPAIGLVLIAIGVEPEYRSISRSLSGCGSKWELNAPIAVESEMMDLLRLLKLIWQLDLSMLAIGVETEYKSVTRSLFGWGPKRESNAPITVESEVVNFLRLLKLIWRSDLSMIAIAAGSDVVDFCYGWRYHAVSFGLVVPYWLGLNKFLLKWWHVACWSLNAHQFWSMSPDLSHRLVEYGLMKRSRILSL